MYWYASTVASVDKKDLNKYYTRKNTKAHTIPGLAFVKNTDMNIA
jgi:hypothetical protein